MAQGSASTRLTHVALPVSDLAKSIAFYEKWASMELLGQDTNMGTKSAGLADKHGSFFLSLIESGKVQTIQSNFHIGVTCSSQEDLRQRGSQALKAGVLRMGPVDQGQPLGMWIMLADPDGHSLELSYGQKSPISS